MEEHVSHGLWRLWRHGAHSNCLAKLFTLQLHPSEILVSRPVAGDRLSIYCSCATHVIEERARKSLDQFMTRFLRIACVVQKDHSYCYCSLKSLKSMVWLETTHNHTAVVMDKDAFRFLRRARIWTSLFGALIDRHSMVCLSCCTGSKLRFNINCGECRETNLQLLYVLWEMHGNTVHSPTHGFTLP